MINLLKSMEATLDSLAEDAAERNEVRMKERLRDILMIRQGVITLLQLAEAGVFEEGHVFWAYSCYDSTLKLMLSRDRCLPVLMCN